MVRFAILGSGSRSNSYFFSHGLRGLVIDNGFSLREFHKRMERAGFPGHPIDTIFLTHTHGDHVKGVENLVKETGATLVHHQQLKLSAVFRRIKEWKSYPVEPRTSHFLNEVNFYPFSLSHDAPGALGYHFKLDDKRFTLITDTGITDDSMVKLAARADVLFLESNYCPQLLKEGPYPQVLQDRVSSDLGHLSNHQAAEFLDKLEQLKRTSPTDFQTQKVFLIHLSENNNTVKRVEEVMKDCSWSGELRICGRNELVSSEI